MSRQTKQHSQQFKQDAVKYVMEHPDLTVEACARNLGIGLSTLSRWRQQYAAKTVLSPPEDPATTLPTNRRKSLVSNANSATLRTRLTS